MDDAAASANEGAEAFLRLDRAAKQAGLSIAAAFAAGQVEGRKLDDVLRSVGQKLAQTALQTAGRALFGSLATTLTQTFAGGVAGATGGISALAAPASLDGLDAVSQVAAPAAARSNAALTRPLSVSMTVNTPDAESFRRSEAQVSAALARAVQRGQRAL
jgi:hypothetical protein